MQPIHIIHQPATDYIVNTQNSVKKRMKISYLLHSPSPLATSTAPLQRRCQYLSKQNTCYN